MNAITAPADRLVKTSEAAKILGISASTLMKMRCRAAGPRYLKMGKTVRYWLSDLYKWTDQYAVTTTDSET